LPFRKKGKKHNPSSRKGVQSLYQQNKSKGKSTCYWLPGLFKFKQNCVFTASSPSAIGCALGECRAGGSREKNQVNPVNPVRKSVGFMYK
jgi:hypothetical protein